MKVFVATFHGDIADKPPMCNWTLEALLEDIKGIHGYGTYQEFKDDHDEEYREYTTPDPEDDKIEVWEFDGDTKEGKIVWGFWGWHWTMPEYQNQGTMPGDDKSLYELANE